MTAILSSISDAGYTWISVAASIGALVAFIALAWSLLSDMRSERSLRPALGGAAAMWKAPSGATMFCLGLVVSLPLWASHMVTLAADSDSARLVAAIAYVRRFGGEYLVDTQEVLMPHGMLRLAMTLGGVPAMKVVCVISMQLLVGVITYVTWRFTRSMLASLAAAFAILAFPGVSERALLLPMYGLMLASGTAALVFMWDAAQADRWGARLLRCLGAAIAFIVSVESHQVGQVWLLLSALLIVVLPPKRFMTVAVATYGLFGLLMIPRLLINVSEGGTDGILSNRIDYWITQDYLTPIQVEFWKLPVDLPYSEYLTRLPHGLVNVAGYVGFGVLFLVCIAALLARGRWRVFGMLAFGLIVGMAIYRKLPFYSRYFAHLLVGAAVAAGVAVALIRRRGPRYRWYSLAALTLLGVLALSTVTLTAQRAGAYEDSVFRGAYGTMEGSVPEGAFVAGTRATYLNFIRDDIIPFGEMFFTEDEYATFLSWPSDDEVIDVLRSREIDYVMIPLRAGRWVLSYNDIWLAERGERTFYHRRVRRSDRFCLVAEHRGAALYRVSGSDGAAGSGC